MCVCVRVLCVCIAVSRCNGVYIGAAYYREKILPGRQILHLTMRARALLRCMCVHTSCSATASSCRRRRRRRLHPNTQTRVVRTIQEIFYASLLSRASECALSSTRGERGREGGREKGGKDHGAHNRERINRATDILAAKAGGTAARGATCSSGA